MKRISLALNIVTFITAALFVYALSSGAELWDIIAISLAGVVCTILIALKERLKIEE